VTAKKTRKKRGADAELEEPAPKRSPAQTAVAAALLLYKGHATPMLDQLRNVFPAGSGTESVFTVKRGQPVLSLTSLLLLRHAHPHPLFHTADSCSVSCPASPLHPLPVPHPHSVHPPPAAAHWAEAFGTSHSLVNPVRGRCVLCGACVNLKGVGGCVQLCPPGLPSSTFPLLPPASSSHCLLGYRSFSNLLTHLKIHADPKAKKKAAQSEAEASELRQAATALAARVAELTGSAAACTTALPERLLVLDSSSFVDWWPASHAIVPL
jgi:ferredoxin